MKPRKPGRPTEIGARGTEARMTVRWSKIHVKKIKALQEKHDLPTPVAVLRFLVERARV